MSNITTQSGVKQATIEAVILRCACDGQPHTGAECPTPTRINLGVIASYYRNPFVRLYKFLERRLHQWRMS